MKQIVYIIVILMCSWTIAIAEQSPWPGAESALGRKGAVQEDMLKVTFPRSELKVTVGEVTVEPGLALTSWIGFKGTDEHAMMMGDLVLLEKEVTPVMEQLVAKGIDVTALHNHILNESPTVMYLHFGGHGDAKKLAEAMRAALSVTGTPMGVPQPATPQATAVDWTKVEAVFAKSGQKKGNLLQMSFPRKEKIVEHGMNIPSYMGMATGINIQAVGNKAATTGDFVLLGNEVNPVVQTLTSYNIAVTAIHSHMLHESPRLFFLHFWGYDEPEKLARGLKAALDKTNSKK